MDLLCTRIVSCWPVLRAASSATSIDAISTFATFNNLCELVVKDLYIFNILKVVSLPFIRVLYDFWFNCLTLF